MIAGDRLADVLVVGHGEVAAAVYGGVEVLRDAELVPGLQRELAQYILVVGIDADGGVVDLPLGVATDGAAADYGVVARLVERIAVIRVEIKVDGREGVRERLRLLPALAVHPGEIAERERRGFGVGLCGRGRGRGRRGNQRLWRYRRSRRLRGGHDGFELGLQLRETPLELTDFLAQRLHVLRGQR